MSTGFTTVSASHLQDATGTPITNATISFLPVANNGVPLSFRTGGTNGQVVSQAVSTTVTAGAFSIVLADTSLTTPVNVGYRVTVTDNISGKVLLANGYGCFQPSGDTFSFDTYQPNFAAQITVQTGPAGESAYQVWLAAGNAGSVQQYLASLQGTSGVTTPNFTAAITAPKIITPTIVSAAVQTVPGGGDYWITNIGTNRRIKQWIREDGSSFGINFPTDGLLTSLRPNSLGLVFAQTSADGRRFPFGWDAAGNLYMAGKINPVVSVPLAAPYAAPLTPDSVYSPQGFVSALNHATIIGQSLSTGEDSPAITTVQPFNNVKFSDGVTDAPGTSLASATLIPLVADTGSQGTGAKETLSNGCADHIANDVTACDLSHPMLLSGSGIPGTTYAAMAGPTDFGGQGSPSFLQCMAQIAAGKALAPSTYSHKATFQLHGETDAQNGNANYAANLVTWQSDIQTGSHAITGSKATIPMFMGQCIYQLTGLQQLATAMSHPATHVMVGPEYCIPHVTTAQLAAGAVGLHLGSYGERLMGEYFAKAYKRVVLQGGRWTPLVW